MTEFRVLSLSGGGARGIFQAIFLRQFEKRLGCDLRDHFDLIAGTSTGSIVGMAIALGVPLETVVEFYQQIAPEIFTARWLAPLRKGTRYSQPPLRAALERVFGSRVLKDARPVLITASSLERFEHRVFTNLPAISPADMDLPATDVVLASAAAPTYFPPVKPKGQERSYVDGGLWGNSPSLLAVLAAHRHLSIPLECIKLLSIGTGFFPHGTTPHNVARLRPFSIGSVNTVFELMWGTQASFSDEYARVLLGDDRFTKCDVALNLDLSLDDAANALALLPPLAEKEYRANEDRIVRTFGTFRSTAEISVSTSRRNRTAAQSSTLDGAGLTAAFPHRSISIRSEYDRRMDAARNHADVLGFGLSSFREDHLKDFPRWKLHVPIRILLLDPEYPSAEHSYAHQRDAEERNPVGTISSQVLKFIEETRHLRDERFHIRLYRCLPMINMFRIDDDVLWGPFVIPEQSRNTPTFLCSRGGFLFDTLASHFESIWQSDTLSRPA